MTKSKSSTIAIVVLSVLLAAALASTIVLAAFNFSRQTSTTLTFGGGVELKVANTTMNSSAQWRTYQVTTAGAKSAEITGNTTSLTTGAQLAAFDVVNTSETAVAIAFKLTKTGGAPLYVTDDTTATTDTALAASGTSGDNYNASGTLTTGTTSDLDGWFVITSVDADATAHLVKYINTIYSADAINDLVGNETATVQLQLVAVPAGANATAALTAAITADEFETISSGEVVSE